MHRRCAPGHLVCRALGRRELFLESQTVVARSNVGRSRPGPPARGGQAALGPARPAGGGGRMPGRLHGDTDRGPVRSNGGGSEDATASSARTSTASLRACAVRIAFDVSPLSHPLLGIGNYIQGSLGDSSMPLPGSTRSSRSHRRASAGPRASGRRSRTSTSSCGRGGSPFARPPNGVERARPPAAERILGPFDVLHFSDWMYPPQRAGVRATTIHDLVPLHHPEWTTARTRSMHARKYRNAARPATSSS